MRLFATLLGIGLSSVAMAQNPFVQTWFTSDPAPMVHDGTMYVYTGHDEDNADFFWMQEWRAWSFQGGEPASSSEENPTVTYNNTGTFTVSLTARR